MIKVTQQQRDNALEALHIMWPSVPPENVAHGLSSWVRGGVGRPHCGTVACFGGWCAWWPKFQAQGVCASPISGAPLLRGDKWRDGAANSVSEMLFGYRHMFVRRYDLMVDRCFAGTDHEVVTRRLQWLINQSEVV